MTAPIVSVDNIVKCFVGMDKPALNGLSATIYPGKMTGLVGPDGAGKTTFIRHVIGLMHADSGSIHVAGFESKTEADKIHELSGYMPQKFGLYEDLTVIENLNLYADLRAVMGKARTKRFAELLKFTDLARFQTRLAGKLSGGMKQKLGLACALVGSPQLLLLDEPSVGVDPISRRELWKMVQALLAEGMAVLWSTAYLDEAEKCDSVILLNEGEKLYDGAPDAILDNLQQRKWQLNGVAMEQRRAVLMDLLKQSVVMDATIQGKNIQVLVQAGASKPEVEYGDWQHSQPTFEDAFIDKLGGGAGGHSALAEQISPKADDGKPVVNVEGLTKRFGDFTAVSNNTFQIKRGEIFGLLGPQWCRQIDNIQNDVRFITTKRR